jgi:predicted MPP superfamily phosphohydrolase
VGGLVSPEFEIFPKMYQGMNDMDGMKLVISRGLGNSILPVRINNYPEVVVVKVH